MMMMVKQQRAALFQEHRLRKQAAPAAAATVLHQAQLRPAAAMVGNGACGVAVTAGGTPWYCCSRSSSLQVTYTCRKWLHVFCVYSKAFL
jgi:hypothetical protein